MYQGTSPSGIVSKKIANSCYLRETVAFAVPNTELTVTCCGSTPKLATIFVSLHETIFAVTVFVTARLPLPLVTVAVTEVGEPWAYPPNPVPRMVTFPW